MGNLAAQELGLILIVLLVLIGLPILCYRLGQKSGYKKGKLDVYEEERRNSKNI